MSDFLEELRRRAEILRQKQSEHGNSVVDAIDGLLPLLLVVEGKTYLDETKLKALEKIKKTMFKEILQICSGSLQRKTKVSFQLPSQKTSLSHHKLFKLFLIIFGIFLSLICIIVVIILRMVLFTNLKITTSVTDYDIFVAPVVEETVKFTFILASWYLMSTHSAGASIELTDVLLFGASLGIGYGLAEKSVVFTNISQINQEVILLKVVPSTLLHFFTSLIHSYNVFRFLVIRKSLTTSVVLFFSAIALHMLFNIAMVSFWLGLVNTVIVTSSSFHPKNCWVGK
jgi:hypothetical protein